MDATLLKRIADLEEKEKILGWLIGKLVSGCDSNSDGNPIGMIKNGEKYELIEDEWWADDISTIGKGLSPIACIKDAMQNDSK